jgi:hypothetical protein
VRASRRLVWLLMRICGDRVRMIRLGGPFAGAGGKRGLLYE